MIVHFTGSEWRDCTDSVFSIFPSGWSYWWSHCSIIVLWGVSLNIWCSAVQSVVGATHLYTIYILSTHYLHCYHQSIVTIYLMSEEGSDPSCCLGCVHNITGLLQFLLKIGEEQLTIQISFLITIHYLHTIYTLSKHYLFLICSLSTQCQYLVQSAVVYWVHTPSLVSSENPSLEDNLETHGSSLSSTTSSNQQPATYPWASIRFLRLQ